MRRWPATPDAGQDPVETGQSQELVGARRSGQQPRTPAKTLLRLAQDKRWEVRTEVALNHRASSKVLEMLAQDDNKSVRTAVALNPEASGAELRRLAGEGQVSGGATTCRGEPQCPQWVIRKLAADESRTVRRAADDNHRSPKKVK